MMNNVSKSAALMNAQAVMALAVQFECGEVFTLSVNDSAVVLTILFDSSCFVEERELEWICIRALKGVRHWCVIDNEVNSASLFICWDFNPWLK